MTKEYFEKMTYSKVLGESEEMVNEFISYWTEKSLNGKKMRFEKEKVFDIKRRFATWKRNAEKWASQKQKPDFNTYAMKVTSIANELSKEWNEPNS
jgi:hypothetical protein